MLDREISLYDRQGDDLWTSLLSMHKGVVEAMRSSEHQADEYLASMFAQPIMRGIAQGDIAYKALLESPHSRAHVTLEAIDKLLALSDALATAPIENPEQGPWGKQAHGDVEKLLTKIEDALSVQLAFPKFYGSVFGISSIRGVFHDRDCWAIYVASRIASLVKDRKAPICEIGGGAGHLAYYCWMLGFRNYTIIDLPTVNVIQAYFLRRNLPEAEISLSGERSSFNGSEGVRILSPRYMRDVPNKHFSLAVNVDSFPEIFPATVQEYLRSIRRSSSLFLSVNQEAMVRMAENDIQTRVRDNVGAVGGFKLLSRHPFWLRKGYVEEIYLSVN